MGKTTGYPREGQSWELAIFFQWQFLIRSKQFENFCKEREKEIDFLISEDDRLSKILEILLQESEKIRDTLREINGLSKRRKMLLQGIEEARDRLNEFNYGYLIPEELDEDKMGKDELEERIENKRRELEEHEAKLETEINFILNERREISVRAHAIQKEAEEKFKIWTRSCSDLLPKKDILPHGISFQGIKIPFMEMSSRKLDELNKKSNGFYEMCVERITYVGELKKIAQYSTLGLNLDGKLLEIIFKIDTRLPHFFIVKSFSKKLKKIMESEKKTDALKKVEVPEKRRKEWNQWKEALEVYDLCEAVKKSYKGKGYLLETARRMGKKYPDDTYWQDYQKDDKNYSKPHLSDRVRKKYGVAKRLINLAGEGKLVAAID